MIDQQFIKKPMGFHKQRLDAFVRSVKTNKEDVQRKALDEALEQHTMMSAQDMMGRAMQLPPFEDLQQMYAQQMMGGMPQAAYGMEIGAVMPSAPAPFAYPSQMTLTPPSSEAFKKQADKYEGKGLNALKGLFNTTANTILNPAIAAYNKQVYANQQAAEKDEEDADIETQKEGGSTKKLPKAQITGTVLTNLQNALANYNSDEPAYDDQGNLLTKEQLQDATEEAYRVYYEAVGQANKDNPMPSMGGYPDLSYLYNYPTRDGLNLPNVSVSGPGASPELLKGTAAPQTYTNMGIDRPGAGAYMGLSPYRYMTIPDMEYSQNYKEMYKDAMSKGQYDRFLTEFEANPTAAGRFFDKMGIGKMFDTRNYDINQTILPEGQSIFDADRMEANRNRAIRAQNADMPGGGLFQTDEIDPYIWEGRTRRERKDALESAGIDPNRKNLRRLGKDYFENLAQERQREEYEASREGYENTLAAEENKLAAEEAAIKSGAVIGTLGKRPRNPYDLFGTGVQTSTPAAPPAVPAVGTNQPAPGSKPRIYAMGRGDAASRKQFENNIIAPEDALASRFQRFEREEGSAMGAGLDNYGWNNLPVGEKQPTNIKEATDLFQRTYGAKAKALGITNDDASTYVADYMFNSGRKPEDFLLYASGIVSLADVNGTASLDDKWQANKNQILKDINSGKISMETLAQKRDDILRTTKPKVKPTNPNDASTAVPNDAYINSWQKRAALPIENLPISDRYEPTKKQDGGTMLPMFQIDGEFGFDNGLTELSYPARNMTAEYMSADCPEGYRRGSDGMCYPIIGQQYYNYYIDSITNDQKLTGLDAKPLPLALNSIPVTQQNTTLPKLPKQLSGINWNISDPLAKKQGPFNYDQSWKTQGLGLPDIKFTDADKMQTFFDSGEKPLTADAFGKQLDQYVPKYTGAEPQTEATASGKGKIRSSISPAGYLNIANATGKYLADGIFSRDERENAERQFRASRFLENNLALTAPDTQFSARLRGFDRATDASGGTPFAGANVQYGQPLIPQYAQKGAELFMTMQEGGVYTLTPEMIKQIIENGGEVEYVDNNYNFDNPYNQ